ncbi:hypothetical protein LXA43DRAFT_141765 [Ganoderma leucocontextum]|nr:hypothetical protein LXA43DRAFT_141765 [Ganoderma leucocontextum]
MHDHDHRCRIYARSKQLLNGIRRSQPEGPLPAGRRARHTHVQAFILNRAAPNALFDISNREPRTRACRLRASPAARDMREREACKKSVSCMQHPSRCARSRTLARNEGSKTRRLQATCIEGNPEVNQGPVTFIIHWHVQVSALPIRRGRRRMKFPLASLLGNRDARAIFGHELPKRSTRNTGHHKPSHDASVHDDIAAIGLPVSRHHSPLVASRYTRILEKDASRMLECRPSSSHDRATRIEPVLKVQTLGP